MSNQLTKSIRAKPSWRLWKQWTIFVAGGELLGFVVPSVAGVVVAALGVSGINEIMLMTIAGIGEGAVLGGAQWLVLRRYLPALKWQAWVLATALAAGLAWIIAMSFGSANLTTFNPVLLGLGAVPLGLLFLLTMGGSQWLVLRRHISKSHSWILVNALAWPLGVAVPVIALALVPDGAPSALIVAVGIISGLLMGAVVGAITGITLVRLLQQAGTAGSKPS